MQNDKSKFKNGFFDHRRMGNCVTHAVATNQNSKFINNHGLRGFPRIF